MFVRGDLKQSGDEAHRAYQRFRDSEPEWAWKFRILEAESLLWRGMYSEVLTLLSSSPAQPNNPGLTIGTLALQGAAHARLHHFAEAEQRLGQAEQLCTVPKDAACGKVASARGVLAVQQGQLGVARQFFEQALGLARAAGDHLLEATALLNLGLVSLRQQHFDEAIDRTKAADQASSALQARNIAQVAQGNLGWAYYNLGDSERSLQLSLEAEGHAVELANVIDQLSWLTNAGYVYADLHDFAHAKQSYLEALALAQKIGAKEDVYNALRALALVSVESGELEEANKYSDQAMEIAHADHNRLGELYPLLVKGRIAVRLRDREKAERILREVEQDPNGNAALRWKAEHALAQLHEAEDLPELADREYRIALTTFEAARSQLRRYDSRLPFSSNASRIYDDYVHFLVARGRPSEALRWADYSRARALLEGLTLLPKGASVAPAALDAQAIARRANGTILFYWLGQQQSYLWTITPRKTNLAVLPAASEIETAVQRYRKSVTEPQGAFGGADDDGQLLYGMLVAPAQALLPKDAKVFVVPDGGLNNLNFETLIVSKPRLHYWIEDVTIASASSLRVLAASLAVKAKPTRGLLLVGDSIAPGPDYPELPKAAAQMDAVARHFPAEKERLFKREGATATAYLTSSPEKFTFIHFVAHGTASRMNPLDSAIVLSRSGADSDSFKLYARDIVGQPLRAKLVTISACYGTGTRSYSGEGLVGLSWAFLRAGAHNVIAALWEVSDASTEKLMDRLYEELGKGKPPDVALRLAKLSLLRSETAFRKPFYWAPFQLYVGS